MAKLRDDMDAQHKRRELALSGSRKIIQTASKCIRHVHRKQFDEAKGLLEQGIQQSRTLRAEVQDAPGILYAGYIQDAEKELVEAAAVLAAVLDQPVPTCEDLGIDIAPYLNGLAEAASECRRTVLDELRHGSIAEAERMMIWMEEIYEELISFDFPDALTGGLRRTCDALRAVLERTRSDLTLTINQRVLLDELKRH
ncbi:MAG: hypothetical protein JNK63_04700 [Chthonomonas sp.]|nr:hypothetical protein [Chthonomonas sp.]